MVKISTKHFDQTSKVPLAVARFESVLDSNISSTGIRWSRKQNKTKSISLTRLLKLKLCTIFISFEIFESPKFESRYGKCFPQAIYPVHFNSLSLLNSLSIYTASPISFPLYLAFFKLSLSFFFFLFHKNNTLFSSLLHWWVVAWCLVSGTTNQKGIESFVAFLLFQSWSLLNSVIMGYVTYGMCVGLTMVMAVLTAPFCAGVTDPRDG